MIPGRGTAAAHRSLREWVKCGDEFHTLWDYDPQGYLTLTSIFKSDTIGH